ncbi:alpha-1,3-mannosyl-glycoprotein 4-beta-N-acetylglucosaminyltransferase C-like [Eublepharis macularius]|uniref:Alpha-1,3-mannosyl-glycoprotein 4-beta-N-acetylglucosaminyltransferase C-like n=1 Tax=Eublepharis macularius TaxID=481883 RepID=A0AA97IUT6_EUBMA|nr:alpha-1,3-mannosyl-glycoprotein 4-beta-N-acetylglucosaminyltransferase C-like [Eublepharis macularius]
MKTRNFKTPLACYWRTFSRLCFLLALLTILIVIIWKQSQEQCKCPETEESGFQDAGKKEIISLENIWKMPQNPNFTVMENAMGPLPIPYKYLLGYPPAKKKFLTIGISAVHREREHYLLRTLESIYNHCKPEELNLIMVVIYLANNDSKLNEQSAKEIKAQFGVRANEGQLLVIESSLAGYPPLRNMKGTSSETQQKALYRSKQNVDYSYLLNFCAGLSWYYLMLEDDIVCANNFVLIIQHFIQNEEKPWTTIAFSRLGCIGKLYHSSDLIKLARFLLMFYDQMPADWLLDLFHKSQTQKDLIIFRPSLFQHIGRVSSFHSMENQLQDPEFQEETGDFGDFPTASCFTNIPVFADYIPAKVCPPAKGLFWGKNITSQSFFTIVFANPIVPQKIQIYTGSAEYNQDILHYGYVETGRLKIHTHDSETCLIFNRIGDFNNGLFEMKGISSMDDIDCLRIQATAPQKQWLQIRRISIWVKNI